MLKDLYLIIFRMNVDILVIMAHPDDAELCCSGTIFASIDKGLSVGERSKLNMHNGVIMYSNIGIASKDDAITNVKNVAMNNMNICLAAYNKKKEFSGGQLISNKNYCEFNVKIALVDKSSKIILNNEQSIKDT